MKRCLCMLTAALLLLSGCQKGPKSLADPVTYTSFPSSLSAHKVGVIPRKATPTAGGLYYQENSKYGIMSFDGTADSGALYRVCRPLGKFFLVAEKTGSEDDVTSFNTAGVVDANGNMLVPMEYASIDMVDDRFVRAVKITGTTESEEEEMTNFADSKGNTIRCKGAWYLIDLQTGKMVPGATGTSRYAAYSYGGNYVKYVTDDKQQICATPEGELLPTDAVHLNNGYYVMKAENAVYNGQMEKVFTYDPNGYIPQESQNVSGYILASKKVDGKDSYVLMDLEGQVVTAAFDSAPHVYGELLLVGNLVYNFEGKQMANDPCSAVYMDHFTRQCWVLIHETTKEKIMIDKNGKELFRCPAENTVLNVNTFALQEKDGDKRINFLFKDREFSVNGTMLSPWLAKVVEVGEPTYALQDTISGEPVLSGYMDYKCTDASGGVLYVYAETENGELDIYRVY